MNVRLPNRLEHLLSHPEEFADETLVVTCPNPKVAQEIHQRLLEDSPDDEVFHVDHYPCTNDDDGTVEHYALCIRRLTYSRDLGWVSSDIPDTPDFNLVYNAGNTPTVPPS